MAMQSLSRSAVISRRGMVCSTSPLAASAGINVLLDGGNAFDASIAVAAAEAATVRPMCGLGGDAFVILYQAATGKVVGINGSGAAATGSTPEFYRSKGYRTIPLEGPLAVTVPGEVDAWVSIHERFCTKAFASLLDPAIGYAEEGCPVMPRLSRSFANERAKLSKYPATAEVLLKRDGRPYEAGDILVQKDLARTLKRVANGGADEFYRGELAREMVKGLRDAGGLFTEEDFANHTTEMYEPPISTTYRGRTVYQLQPPSQGFLLLEILNILEGYDLASMGHNSAEAIHLMVEAKKLAFADLNRYGADPRFGEWPLESFISKEHAEERRKLLDPVRCSTPTQEEMAVEADGDTSYFCVADGEGNSVSFVHSLSNAFGSGYMAQGTGVLFNNRASRGFSLQHGHPNIVAPGKRPMHTLNCYIVFEDNRPTIIGGTPGGDFQPQWGAQIITNMLDFGLGPQEAVEAPRWASLPGADPATIDDPMELRLEHTMPDEAITGLGRRGHKVVRLGPGEPSGRVQLILRDHARGVMLGASDPRGDGHAAAL